MKKIFLNDCAADQCHNKNTGNGSQLCKVHKKMYEIGQRFKAFYGQTLLKKDFWAAAGKEVDHGTKF